MMMIRLLSRDTSWYVTHSKVAIVIPRQLNYFSGLNTILQKLTLQLTEVPAGSESMYLESTNGLAPYDFVLLVYDVVSTSLF